ncbi:MAG: acyl-CoA dehydrogenase family protein [Sandaracinus sp.]|nr:acyl-CoA dehydrogenase family protein [Sandaracinus sp.]MCB9616260.1 acyl-CoA dehydrogenase family protein [Sandaracinus sp.]MCB9617998.1 acyl-CoA dehydrogenase family protein [Sandaracinus sp.]MCB9636870.1 acyl-CoA dehydrogenase family protein [Sandaracinus sp.]
MVDYYGIDDELSSEERQIRDATRRFMDAKVQPIISRCYQDGVFPTDLIPGFAELGLLGANLEGYGCAGMGDVAYGLAMQELERCDSGIRSFCSVQGSLCMYPIWAFGSEEQKQRYLPGMAKGEIIGCFGLTEPDFGSNPTGMITRADALPGGGFKINGTKRWITNGNLAKVAIIWARVQGTGDEKRDGKVHGFLVPTESKGFTAIKLEEKFSLRASVTSELILEDVEVGADALLPGVIGMRGPLSCLSQARYGICWGAIGAAMSCYETALSYAKDRVQFSKPIAGYQLVQQKLVHMLTEITKAQCLTLRLGRLKEAGKVKPQQISLAKRNNVSHALEIARVARDVLGGNGIMYDYPVGRHLMNLETVYTYEGTHDIHTLIVGQDITGIPAFD